MFGRLWTIVVKEILSYMRDPRSRAVLIEPPLIQLLIFTFAATLDVRNVDIAVLDQDNGKGSYEFISRLSSSYFVDDVISVNNMEELSKLINRRQVLLGVHISPDFSRDLIAEGTGTAQLIVDGRRANAGQIAVGYINSIANEIGMELRQQLRQPPQAINANTRHWFNQNLIYQWFIIPSLAGMLAMVTSILITSLSIAREREHGTFDQLLVSPVTPLEIIMGKSLPALIIGTTLASIMVCVGIFVFKVPFHGNIVWLFLSLVLFILSIVGIGLTISSLCMTQQQAILGTISTIVPVILISGFATPVENMPQWLQYLAEASPLKHFLIIVQGSFLKALPVEEIIANALPLALIAFFTLTFATFSVKRTLQ